MTDILNLIPKERPTTFDQLSDEEKRVRGRYFLMVYAMGASVEYAWFHALDASPQHSTEMRAIVGETIDEDIEQALGARNEPGRAVLDWTST